MNEYDRLLPNLASSPPASKGWWRWPLMPVAAIIGAALGTIVVSILQWIGMKLSGVYHESGWYFTYVLPLVTWGCFGYLFTFISYHVAPTGKVIASTVMATAFCVIMLLVVLFGVVHDAPTLTSGIQTALSFVALVVGTIYGIIQAKEP